MKLLNLLLLPFLLLLLLTCCCFQICGDVSTIYWKQQLKDENMTGKCLELLIIRTNRGDNWSSLILEESVIITQGFFLRLFFFFPKIFFFHTFCFVLTQMLQWFKNRVRWRATATAPQDRPPERKGAFAAMNTGVCEYARKGGTGPPASTQFLAHSLCKGKCNAEKSSCFTASRIFLLTLTPSRCYMRHLGKSGACTRGCSL